MSLVTQVGTLTTRIAGEIKSVRTLVNGNVLDLSGLTTTAKGNLMLAINELDAAIDAVAAAAGAINDGVTATTSTWSSTKTNAEIAAAVSALVAAAPGLLDTLNELAAALGDDPNFAATMTTALGNKQPLDTDLTAIAALVSAADKLPYSTGAGLWSLATFTAAGRALVDDIDIIAQRTTLGLGTAATTAATAYEAAGAVAAASTTDRARANHTGTQLAATVSDFSAAADARIVAASKQPLDADLTAIAALVSGADLVPYATGIGTWALASFTAYGRSLAAAANAAAARVLVDTYSTTEIGLPTTDFVTVFNTGLI